jgi:Peptidase family S41/N-terminal domain of Peptidase_S41 in eukaryotic IRBP
VERAAMDRIEHQIDREVKARFPDGAVRRVALLRHGDDPRIEPGELLVRVFIGAAGGPEDYKPEDYRRSLDAWEHAHQARMKVLRRELSLRLPAARLLEFTVADASDPDAAPRITMPDDPELAGESLSGREIVRTALALLRTSYVFPDRAEQAAAAVEARLAAGEYDGMEEAALADRLTTQLYEICADRHLRVRLRGPGMREPAEPAEPAGPPGPETTRREWERPVNCGIYRAERLEGNIGYLDLRGVADPEHAGPVIAAAMELVAGTYALIIDLRRNGGGSPDGVVFWCSYLFPGAGTHLNDIFHAGTGETRQFWSLAYVPGSRYLDRPVYLLTSRETFSGGEDFCYTLQAQGRAELIGDTTGGGAHPTRTVPISSTMAISVPFARSVNPVTGTNWEGTGVVPDIAVPAAEAYDVAYGKALRHVLSITVPPPIADEARAALAELPAPRQD